ncbi:MAG: carboxypeptidase regulatory-like domain-containing protein, partial [Planctomycetes bacterium]|nr:carboxypeptidase regulatory-like domain-containing protein [Planctomycetota bacterium]
MVATIRIGSDDGGLVEEAGTLANEPLAVAATDANGVFSCAVAIDEDTDLRVHAEAPGRAPVGARGRISPGETWDLGDIRLVRTTSVRGVVVDTSGAPVAGAEVGIVMIGHDPPVLQFRESHSTLTDDRGEFVFGDPVATGEWYVRVERTGALRSPRKLQTEAGQSSEVRIEVERPDPALALHGQVVDVSGNPLAGVALSVYGAGSRGSAESDADGRFVVHKGPPHPDQGEPGLDVQASRVGFEQTSPRKNE